MFVLLVYSSYIGVCILCARERRALEMKDWSNCMAHTMHYYCHTVIYLTVIRLRDDVEMPVPSQGGGARRPSLFPMLRYVTPTQDSSSPVAVPAPPCFPPPSGRKDVGRLIWPMPPHAPSKQPRRSVWTGSTRYFFFFFAHCCFALHVEAPGR